MFALILLTDGTYNICDIKRIRNRRRDNTCTVNLHNQRPRPARLLACNGTCEVLVEIKKLLNTGSPKVRITALADDTAGSNNSSIFDYSASSSGVLDDDTLHHSNSKELPASPKKIRDNRATGLQHVPLAPDLCCEVNFYDTNHPQTVANTETVVRVDDDNHNCTVNNDVSNPLAVTPRHDNVIGFNENIISIYRSDLALDTNETIYFASENPRALVEKNNSPSNNKVKQPNADFENIEKSEYVAIENIDLDLNRTENRAIVSKLIQAIDHCSLNQHRSAESTYGKKQYFKDINANLEDFDSQEQLVNNRKMNGESFDTGQQYVDNGQQVTAERLVCLGQCTKMETVDSQVSHMENIDQGTRGVGFDQINTEVVDEREVCGQYEKRVGNKKTDAESFSEVPQCDNDEAVHVQVIESGGVGGNDREKNEKIIANEVLSGNGRDPNIEATESQDVYGKDRQVNTAVIESGETCEDQRINPEAVVGVGLYSSDVNALPDQSIEKKKQSGTQNLSAGVIDNREQYPTENQNTDNIENERQCGKFNVNTAKINIQDLISTARSEDVISRREKERKSSISVRRRFVIDNIYGIDSTDDMSSDDSDYQPSDRELTPDEDDEIISDSEIQKSNSERKKKIAQYVQTPSNRLSLSFTDNVSGASTCDDTRLRVDPSRGPAGDKKQNCCLFCHKPQSKIARHLQTVHKDEPEVQKFMMLPKKSKLRQDEIALLRKKGNFLFNTNAELNTGSRIVTRRPNKKFNRTGSDYAHCARCKGSYSKLSIRIHFKNCTGISSKKHRLVMLSSKQVAGMVHSSANDVVRRRIIPVLRDDNVARAVRYDELLITHTNKQCQKYRSEHFDKMIRQRLRMLGRLLLAVRTINKNVTDFASIFNPEVYDDCISAVNSVAGLNESTNSYTAPSTASMLGTLIKQIGKVHISDCIKKKHTDKKKDAEDFLKLLDEDYTISVNSTVSENQAERRRQKDIKIPTMDDIQKLNDFLSKERNKALDNLKIDDTPESWRDLAETTLTTIQLFNRRRAGEMERIKVADFERYKGIDETVDKDLWDQLSEISKAATCKYVRFEIRGKKGRTVAVLLSSHMLECLKVILEKRKMAGVLSTNPYVFGIPSNSTAIIHKHLDSCVLMRKFSEACGASDPQSLRGTELRKHMATKVVALNLNDQDVGEVATFMGHSTDIHKQVYRQSIGPREIMKMSILLQKAQGDVSDEEVDSDPENDENEDVENQKDEDVNHAQDACGHAHAIARRGSESAVELNSDEALPLPSKKRGRPTSKNVAGSSRRGNKRGNVEVVTQTTEQPTKKRRSSSPHGPVRRTAWTRPEKDILLTEFGVYVSSNSKTFPSLKSITECIRKNPTLQARTPQQVKSWLSNQKQLNIRKNDE